MSTNQSYLEKYNKRNSKEKLYNSQSVNKNVEQRVESPNKIGNIISKLEDRIDGVEVKMVSLTNVVKLLQKYTETKDQQYERQKQNMAFQSMNIKVPYSENALPNKICIQFQDKVKQFQHLSKKLKDQLIVVESLKVQMARDNSQKLLETQAKTCTLPVSGMKSIDPYDMPDIIEQLQDRIRDQLNRKIQICMNTFKSVTQNTQNNHNSSLNRVMLQQQIHNLTLTINKLENQNVKNIQLIENRVDEIVNHVKRIQFQGFTEKNNLYPSKSPKQKIVNKQSRSRSKSQPKRDKQVSMVVGTNQQRKRIKQEQLRQAIKKKKQITEKLKMK